MRAIKKIRFGYYVIMLFAMVMVVTWYGCTKSNNIEAPISSTANIMIDNALATPSSTPVSCYLDNQKITTAALAYGNVPVYLVIKPDYTAATFKNAALSKVADSPIKLAASASYTLFLYGSLATPLILLTSDTLTAPPVGKARIRFVHLGQNTGGNVDLALRNDYQKTPVAKVIIPDRPYGTASSFVTIDTCTNYSIQVLAKGTNTIKSSTSKIAILPNLNYTILVRGISGGSPALTVQAPINNSLY